MRAVHGGPGASMAVDGCPTHRSQQHLSIWRPIRRSSIHNGSKSARLETEFDKKFGNLSATIS
jgi:hypothetical protein